MSTDKVPTFDIDAFRTSERARMAPMREAARKEAFVQGYMRARADAVGQPIADVDDRVLLGRMPEADTAYAVLRAQRGPA